MKSQSLIKAKQMSKASKTAPQGKTANKQAVIYARVSSKEQEKEGFSIPAQLKLLKEYAAAQGFAVAQEYVDVETAKQTGRAAFGEMVAYLKATSAIRVILVEKTDRLYRNLKDWVTVDELEVEIHLVKEGFVLSRESRSSEKFMHGIKVLMAKNYIDNLSEEARKGMQEKAEQGIWPTKAPLGYRNVAGSGRQEDHRHRPGCRANRGETFRVVRHGPICVERSGAEGARCRLYLSQDRRQRASQRGAFHLAEPALYGSVRVERQANQGARTSRSSRWNYGSGCRACLTAATPSKHRSVTHDFAFSGLDRLRAVWMLSCRRNQEAESYVYYHCTGYADKCRGNPATCRRRYVREEVLEQQFTDLLGRLQFDDEVLEWVREALHASHADERREHEDAIERLLDEHKRIGDRINAMYLDKLDGRVDGAFFDMMSAEWRGEQNRCLREIERHQSAEQSYMDEGIRFSNSRETPKNYSSGNNRAKNAACSISCYRTAPGRTAKWSPLSVNHLICWRKQPPSRRARRRVSRPIRLNRRFGCPSWIRIEPWASPQSRRFGVF